MEDWKQVLAKSIVKPKDLAERFGLDAEELEAIVGPYPMRITPTVLGTIKEKGDAIWKGKSTCGSRSPSSSSTPPT